MRLVIVTLVIFCIAGFGCTRRIETKPHAEQPEPRIYQSEIDRHPVTLTINPDNTYRLGHVKRGGKNWRMVNEDGRWWKLNKQVVLLMPDNTDWPSHFARLSEPQDEEAESQGFALYDDAREAINPELFVATSPDPGFRLSDDMEEKLAEMDVSEEYKHRIRVSIYKEQNPFEITERAYRALTLDPYSREPFAKDAALSQVYFRSFCRGYANTVKDPGGIYYYSGNPSTPPTLWEAADEAGYHAGHTGKMNQLTAEEREELEAWETKYKETMLWPYRDDRW